MSWQVLLHPDVEAWFLGLCLDDPVAADGISDAIDQLLEQGPGLGRPLVDRIQGSRFHNMKELRPVPTGTSEIRMLFAFDPARQAILLVVGDKVGDWMHWYRQPLRLADERYEEHLISFKEGES